MMETGRIAKEEEALKSKNHVTSGTKIIVPTCKTIVDDSTFATGVGNLDIKGRTANNNQSELVVKYLCSFVWFDSFGNDFFSSTVRYMLSDPLLLRPPAEEFEMEAMMTVCHHPHLFRAASPIDVNSFEQLLVFHPNCPFIESVCVSLCVGFWLWAHTQKESYPST
jgi:hypothetical protein